MRRPNDSLPKNRMMIEPAHMILAQAEMDNGSCVY
jgi:hypothetical protein